MEIDRQNVQEWTLTLTIEHHDGRFALEISISVLLSYRLASSPALAVEVAKIGTEFALPNINASRSRRHSGLA